MKRTDDQQFLFETTVEASVKDTVREMVEIHNLRLRINRLKLEGDELAEYGPAREPNKVGVEDESDAGLGNKGPHFKADPTCRRTGNAPIPDVAKVLKKTLADADAAASKAQAANKVVMKKADLLEHIDLIRGAVMICFPMGLPEWDNVRAAIEDKEDLEGTSLGQDILDPETAQCWWAGKQMLPENKLKDHLGKNEKTKIVCKLQKKGQGAPTREPTIDKETQQAMLQFYHKKQEEQKVSLIV